MNRTYLAIIFIIFSFGNNPLWGQQLAFPGAEGFGKYTTGGRGGIVYEVTNLNDSGDGSFRDGIMMTVPRTIVFRVSGTIHLLSELKIRNGNLTIAGQTAPGDGIALKGFGVVVDADNIIIRYIRFRPGDISGGEPDAIWGRNHSDIIIDHCSMSWAVDETSSFYDNKNFTMQWCLLSESLFESQHEKGRHGYGGIWGGQGATFHHNILAHHSSRNPRFNGSRYSKRPDLEVVDFRNNVLYNWGNNSAYGGEEGNQNVVANYYKPGPATSGEKKYRILDAYPLNGGLGKWYVDGNFVEGYPEVTENNWNGGVQRLTEAQTADVRVYEPFASADISGQSAEEAYASALANSGAVLPRRDAVDERITKEIESGTVTYGGAYGPLQGIIDTQEQVGGWPQLFSAPPPVDSDHDGIPDQWEEEQGLDPQNQEDGKSIAENGYSNLENYLSSLEGTEQPAFLRHPTDLSALEIAYTSMDLTWKNNTDEEGKVVLERSTDDNDFSVIAELPEGTTSYLDEALEPGMVYFYRLKAITANEVSAYSQSFSFKTYAEPENPENNEMAGYWPLDALSGNRVVDKSIHGTHGEVKNSTTHKWINGKANNALDLNQASTATRIEIPHSEPLNFANNTFSASFWMKSAAPIEQAYLFHKGTFVENTGTGATGKWYGLEIKNNMVRFAVDDDITKSEVGYDITEFLNNEWVQVVVVRDRADKSLSIFLNGALMASAADETKGEIGSEQPLIIGNSNDLNLPYRGMIDEFRMYAYSLQASEIAELYSSFPEKAHSPAPEDKASVAGKEINLTWMGQAALYDLYVGNSLADLKLAAADLSATSYMLTQPDEAAAHYWRIDSKGGDGTLVLGDVWSFRTESVTSVSVPSVSSDFKIYPNPVSSDFTIKFTLEKPEPVVISVFDVHNKLQHTLIDQEFIEGMHRIYINDLGGHQYNLADGVYTVIIKTSGSTVARRLLLIKKL